jgi:hypothetical protein
MVLVILQKSKRGTNNFLGVKAWMGILYMKHKSSLKEPLINSLFEAFMVK